MSGYSTFLFVHVAGALGFFAALGLEWATLSQLRLAESARQARPWLRLGAAASRMAVSSMLALVSTGGVMMATAWGREPWLIAAMAALVPLAVLALAVSRPRLGWTVKPGLGGAVPVLLTGGVLGLASGLLPRDPRREAPGAGGAVAAPHAAR